MAARFPREFFDAPGKPVQAGPAWQPSAARAFMVSVRCAWDGLRYAFATQQNLRLQLGIASAALFGGWLLRLPGHELALVFALSVFVIYAELVNTAIEHSLNHHVGLAYDPSVKLIKDMAAGSVLVVALAAALIGTVLAAPKLWALYQALSGGLRGLLAGVLCALLAGLSLASRPGKHAVHSRWTARHPAMHCLLVGASFALLLLSFAAA